MERSVTASASAITTVSDSTVGFLSRLQPRTPVHVIPNGYDPEAMAPGRRVSQGRERLTVAFVGSIYGWHPVESFFRVLDAYNREYTDAPVALRMIGVGGASALEKSLRAGFPTLSATTTFLPRLANRDMAVELAQANAFLMFNNYRYTGTKVFDYLALGRHILLCYSDDPEAHALKERYFNLEIVPGADERVLEKLIRDTRSGTVVRDAGHLGTVLEELAREFREDGAIACASTGVERYSRRAETGRLADLIKKAAS
jgi:glycosyltransferase involved in cell wall biosynthesis